MAEPECHKAERWMLEPGVERAEGRKGRFQGDGIFHFWIVLEEQALFYEEPNGSYFRHGGPYDISH